MIPEQIETEFDEKRGRCENRTGRLLGHVVSCSGSKVEITATIGQDNVEVAQGWSVGRLVSISVNKNRVVALVNSMDMGRENWVADGENVLHISAELVGEVRAIEDGYMFSSGISQYPYLGAIAHDIRAKDLELIYDAGSESPVKIGKLSQNQGMNASISMHSMLSRHFALVGTTGVGKSTALSLLVKKAVETEPKLRVLVLDIHDEYASAFGDKSVPLGPDNLELPFWLFKLDELSAVIFRGQEVSLDEVNILRELVCQAKNQFNASDKISLTRKRSSQTYTADAPVPYRIADLLAGLDERLGRLDARAEKPGLLQLKARIESAIHNPRFGFMFSSNTITDNIMETIGKIFRIPGDDKPITTLQLAGIPSEVVDSVASVLCRLAFEIGLWSNGALKLLVVCEEAHRYISANSGEGFFPTRQAISRIAKEGRKYGVSLGIVTQRPGELDSTILSQCSTIFAMRLANDVDQKIIRSAIPNSSTSTTSFLASIGNGEAIAFGEAVRVPMRMLFERLPDYELPKASGAHEQRTTSYNLRDIVDKMRSSEDGIRQTDPIQEEVRVNASFESAQRAEDLARAATPQNRLERFAKEQSAAAESQTVRSEPIRANAEQYPPESSEEQDLQQELNAIRAKLLRK